MTEANLNLPDFADSGCVLLGFLGVQGIERYAQDTATQEVHGDASCPGEYVNLRRTYLMMALALCRLDKVNMFTSTFRELLADLLE